MGNTNLSMPALSPLLITPCVVNNVVLISYNTCGKANKKQYQKFSNTANKNGDISMNHNNSSSGNQQMKEIELEKKTDNDV